MKALALILAALAVLLHPLAAFAALGVVLAALGVLAVLIVRAASEGRLCAWPVNTAVKETPSV